MNVREERRLHGQCHGTAVQDASAHEAAAAGEERGEGGGLTSTHTSLRDPRGRDAALRERKSRGWSWGTSPWRRSRGGGGGRERAAAGRGTKQRARAVTCGLGRRGARRCELPPRRREEGRRDRAPWTRLHLLQREAHLCGQGRRIAGWTSSRTRPRRRVRRERAPPDARPRNFRQPGRCPPRADATRVVAGHVAAQNLVRHGEAGRSGGTSAAVVAVERAARRRCPPRKRPAHGRPVR